MGVCSEFKVIVCDTCILCQDPVGCDTPCLEGCVPDLDTVLAFECECDRELVFEVSHVELTDPAVRNTTHVFSAGVCHSFDFSVHYCGLSCHLHHQLSLVSRADNRHSVFNDIVYPSLLIIATNIRLSYFSEVLMRIIFNVVCITLSIKGAQDGKFHR